MFGINGLEERMVPVAIPKDKLSKEKKQMEEKKPYNLLSISILKKFIQSNWYPGIFQWIVLAVFLLLSMNWWQGPLIQPEMLEHR